MVTILFQGPPTEGNQKSCPTVLQRQAYTSKTNAPPKDTDPQRGPAESGPEPANEKPGAPQHTSQAADRRMKGRKRHRCVTASPAPTKSAAGQGPGNTTPDPILHGDGGGEAAGKRLTPNSTLYLVVAG